VVRLNHGERRAARNGIAELGIAPQERAKVAAKRAAMPSWSKAFSF